MHFTVKKIGLNNSFIKCIVNICTTKIECFGCYKMFEICFCPNTFFVVDKRSSFPSKVECHLSFIIDIRPIFYYSLPHKWLSLGRDRARHITQSKILLKIQNWLYSSNSEEEMNGMIFLWWGWHTRFLVSRGTCQGANLAEKLEGQ